MVSSVDALNEVHLDTFVMLDLSFAAKCGFHLAVKLRYRIFVVRIVLILRVQAALSGELKSPLRGSALHSQLVSDNKQVTALSSSIISY